jgi:hypothetical protein
MTQLDNLKGAAAKLEATCSNMLDELRKSNHGAIAKVREQIPNNAAIDAKVNPLRANLKRELDALEQQVNALGTNG